MIHMKFKRKTVNTPEEFLSDIKDGESYVASFLRENEEGMYSAEILGANKNNLYVGGAGILHMYVQLDQVFHEDKYQEKIKKMTSYISKHTLDGVQIAKKEGEFVPGMVEAFYSGIGGIGLILNEVYRLYQMKDAKEGSMEILDHYRKTMTIDLDEIYWTDNSPIFFDGGIILYLIDCYHTYEELREKLLSVIIKAADHILNHAITHENGGLEIDHHHVDFKHKEPNFEFGTAGAGYLFTKVYELTNEPKYLDAADKTTIYLKSIAIKQKEGYLIPYKLGVYDDLFYLGNCHGPVGTAKLFYELYQVTKKEEYLNEIFKLVDGAKSLGAPFAQSDGFWNTTCVCCGPAGYMPLFLGLYKQTGDGKWKKLAHEVGEVLAGTKIKDHWEIAFDRTKPKVITSPAGYFTGAAGIVVMLLEVYCLEKNVEGVCGLIDDPYMINVNN